MGWVCCVRLRRYKACTAAKQLCNGSVTLSCGNSTETAY
jgi:hypothetical protein